MDYELYDPDLPKEGELYKVYEVGGHTYEIRYGYYAENERGRVEPLPIFPDFRKEPVYTADGYQLAALIHSACRYYKSDKVKPENYCGDCNYYSDSKQEIAICKCKKRWKEVSEENITQNGGNMV